MTIRSLVVAALAAALTLTTQSGLPAQAAPASDAALDQVEAPTPIVIGHRGASGYRPEHTLAAYRLAIRQGADYIEPDLVSTKDGVLVARHENEISGTTDVGDHPEFADRRTTKLIDGVSVTGWFTEDFTYRELKTLAPRSGCRRCAPTTRRYDGSSRSRPSTGRSTWRQERSDGADRVYPETKHPTYFDSIGLSLEEPLVATLRGARPRRRRRRGDHPVLRDRQPASSSTRLIDVRWCSWSTPAGRRTTRGGRRPAHLPRPDDARGPRCDRDVRRRHRRQQGPGAAARPGHRRHRRRRPPWSATPTRPAWSCTCGRCAGRTSSWPPTSGPAPTRTRPATCARRTRRSSMPGSTGCSPTTPTSRRRALADWLG